MQGEILQYLQKRRMPLKTRLIARKFGIDAADIIPILNQMAVQNLIRYKQHDLKEDKIDWAGWVPA